MHKKQKILFLVSSMEGGGAERVAAMLCNSWANQGFEVTLMATFSGRGTCIHILDEQVKLEFLADIVNSRSQSLLMRVRRLFALRKYIKTYNPDLIISFLTNVNNGAIIAAFGLGIPVFVSERTYPPFNNWPILIFILRKLFYPFASSVIMQTQDGVEWLKDSIPNAKGTIIENPVIYPLPIPSTRDQFNKTSKIILCVARLSKEKNFDKIIDAFVQIAYKFKDWDLVILGDGPEKKYLKSKILDENLVDRIFLIGRSQDPDFWYKRASIFVMYSRFEGFPNALVEAMSYGLPVISSDCKTGPGDIIAHGKNGLLVPIENNHSNLSYAIESLISDISLQERLGREAKDVIKKYKISEINKKWFQLFNLD